MKRWSILCIMFFYLSACKKHPFDFRNKYVGDYNFVYSYSSWQMNLGVYDSATIYYTGKIYYDEKNKIKINYTTNATLNMDIDKNGNLTLECGANVGKFENKNIVEIAYSTNSCGNGALGGRNQL